MIFTRQKRKVALILDNCTGHPNIKLIFLPPNTTSVTQPMNQGTITSFKTHYLCHFVQHGLLKAMEAGMDFNWTVHHAIYGFQATWSKVTTAIICFSHCGFVAPASTHEDNDDPDDDIPLVCSMLARMSPLRMRLNTVDDNLWTTVPMIV